MHEVLYEHRDWAVSPTKEMRWAIILLFHFMLLDVACYSYLSRSIWMFILSYKLCSFQNFLIIHRFYKLTLRKLYLHIKSIEEYKTKDWGFWDPFSLLIQPLHSSDKDFILLMMNCLHYKDFLKITHYTLRTIFPYSSLREPASNCFSWIGRCWSSCPMINFGLQHNYFVSQEQMFENTLSFYFILSDLYTKKS